MGYHLYNLVYHIIYKTSNPTYMEMLLHHLVTWLLIFYSYNVNLSNFGFAMMMIHDIGDFCMNNAKVCRDLKLFKGWVLDILYASIVITFLYLRVIVMSLTLLPNGYHGVTKFWPFGPDRPEYKYTDPSGYYGIWALPIGMSTIVVLNAYWSYKIIEIGINHNKNASYTSEFEGEKVNKHIK